ncbi:MAG: hypothetical protein ACREA7_08920 [Nitrosotalea sp.]
MPSGETLLKVTDFPFAYSVISVLFVAIGMNIHDMKFLTELGIAGALGTFLTITDPVGRLLKSILRHNLQKLKDCTNENTTEYTNLDYSIRAIGTRSIGIEIDKIVSLLYFAFLLSFISLCVTFSPYFDTILDVKNHDGAILFNSVQSKSIIVIISSIVILILAIVLVRNRDDLRRHVHTAGVYQRGISSEFAMPDTVDSISKAVDQNDWQTAEEWQNVLLKEIRTEKGKKDLLLQSVQNVYRPLYVEMMNIESTYNLVNSDGNFRQFQNAEWMKIKSSPEFLMIDKQIRDQIELFYDVIGKYNKIVEVSNNIASKILRQRVAMDYGDKYAGINYWIESTSGVQAPSLQALMLTGMHPMAQFQNETHPNMLRIELVTAGGTGENYQGEDVIVKFNTFWDNLVKDADNNLEIKRMKGYFRDISDKSKKLKTLYFEKIGKQWES